MGTRRDRGAARPHPAPPGASQGERPYPSGRITRPPRPTAQKSPAFVSRETPPPPRGLRRPPDSLASAAFSASITALRRFRSGPTTRLFASANEWPGKAASLAAFACTASAKPSSGRNLEHQPGSFALRRGHPFRRHQKPHRLLTPHQGRKRRCAAPASATRPSSENGQRRRALAAMNTKSATPQSVAPMPTPSPLMPSTNGFGKSTMVCSSPWKPCFGGGPAPPGQVGTGAEGSGRGTGEYDHAAVVRRARIEQGLGQVVVLLTVERVESIRAVEGDRSHPAVVVDDDHVLGSCLTAADRRRRG